MEDEDEVDRFAGLRLFVARAGYVKFDIGLCVGWVE
jgi:hypothetical protein